MLQKVKVFFNYSETSSNKYVVIVTIFSSNRVLILSFCYAEGQTSQSCTSEQNQILLYCRDQVIDWVCRPQLVFCLYINSWNLGEIRYVPSKTVSLNKKLANTHLSFIEEKQNKAHLFQQQTDMHGCSFHLLSGHIFLQQLSSCKVAPWKSCIHNLDGLMNVLPKQTVAT